MTIPIDERNRTLRELLERLRPRIKGYFARGRFSPQEAEEILQDACLVLVSNWQRAIDLDAYFFGTLRSISIDWKRTKAAERKRTLPIWMFQEVGEEGLRLTNEWRVTWSTSAKQETEVLAAEMLARAGSKAGGWLYKFYCLGMSLEELAEQEGILAESFRRRLHRIRTELKGTPRQERRAARARSRARL